MLVPALAFAHGQEPILCLPVIGLSVITAMVIIISLKWRISAKFLAVATYIVTFVLTALLLSLFPSTDPFLLVFIWAALPLVAIAVLSGWFGKRLLKP